MKAKVTMKIRVPRELHDRMVAEQQRYKGIEEGYETLNEMIVRAIEAGVDYCEDRGPGWTSVDYALRSAPSGKGSVGVDYAGKGIWGLAIPVLAEDGKFAPDRSGRSYYYRPAAQQEYDDALNGIRPAFDPKWIGWEGSPSERGIRQAPKPSAAEVPV